MDFRGNFRKVAGQVARLSRPLGVKVIDWLVSPIGEAVAKPDEAQSPWSSDTLVEEMALTDASRQARAKERVAINAAARDELNRTARAAADLGMRQIKTSAMVTQAEFCHGYPTGMQNLRGQEIVVRCEFSTDSWPGAAKHFGERTNLTLEQLANPEATWPNLTYVQHQELGREVPKYCNGCWAREGYPGIESLIQMALRRQLEQNEKASLPQPQKGVVQTYLHNE
jgi:hypothetical protein